MALMKKTIILTCCLFYGIGSFSQSVEENIVQQFGRNMHEWCSTKDIDYRIKAQSLCSDACRVKDKIMENFGTNSGLNVKDYVVQNYLNGFEDALYRGPVSFSISNIKVIPFNEQYVLINGKMQKNTDNLVRKISVVSCNINVKGSINFQVRDLYYIKDGKIAKITPYEEIVDKTGRRKVKVDFKDIIDFDFEDTYYGEYDAFGGSLSYSKSYPLNIGINYNYSLFNIGLEIGVNWKDKTMSNNIDSNSSEVIFSNNVYGVLNPGIFTRYVTFNCGIGCAFMNGKEINNRNQVLTNENAKFFFMMKPSIEFNIHTSLGLSDVIFSPRIAYNYIPKFQQLNCWEFGIGFRYIIDN